MVILINIGIILKIKVCIKNEIVLVFWLMFCDNLSVLWVRWYFKLRWWRWLKIFKFISDKVCFVIWLNSVLCSLSKKILLKCNVLYVNIKVSGIVIMCICWDWLRLLMMYFKLIGIVILVSFVSIKYFRVNFIW